MTAENGDDFNAYARGRIWKKFKIDLTLCAISATTVAALPVILLPVTQAAIAVVCIYGIFTGAASLSYFQDRKALKQETQWMNEANQFVTSDGYTCSVLCEAQRKMLVNPLRAPRLVSEFKKFAEHAHARNAAGKTEDFKWSTNRTQRLVFSV